MPLSWKKAKGKSFSTLLTNDKRGAALVVETGFPTSLADLFIKNRICFNKNNNNDSNNKNKKKTKKKMDMSLLIPVPDTSNSPNPEAMLNSSSRLSTSSIFSPLIPTRILSSPQISRDTAVDDCIVACEAFDHDMTGGEVLKGKHVVMEVLKLFFVVILALGMNNFAAGMALSALFLLSMKYFGRRFGGSCLFRLVNRHGNMLIMLDDSRIKVPINEIQVDNDCSLGFFKGSLGYSSSLETNDLVSKICVEQTSPNLVSPIRENPNMKCEVNLRSGNEKWAREEINEEREEEVRDEKIQEACIHSSELLLSDGSIEKVTRGSKIRSKIKKFANKLNYSKGKEKKKMKKKAKESKFDAFDDENAKAANWDDVEKEFEVVRRDDSTSSLSPSIGGQSDDDQINVGNSISPENSSSCNENNIECDGGRERNSLSGGYLANIAIVLAGLVGSRLLALVFALSWFLLLKSGFGTRLRCIINW